MSLSAMNQLIDEAERQITVCNACRYCEGFCSVFPAVHRQRAFAPADIQQLANLCHNCRGCFYACQFTEPHEFRINIPQALADVRQQSWENHVFPSGFARLFQQHGVAIALLMIVAICILFAMAGSLGDPDGTGFYAVLPHSVMVTLFAPLFLAPLAIIGVGLHRYWQAVNGERIRLSHLRQAVGQVATMHELSGGQGQGCNFENEDQYTNARRYFHQATMWGFLLCFASTCSGTLMHYLLDMPAPYPLVSVPKLLGVPGGVLLVAGCAGLAWLKLHADKSLGATSRWGGEMAFVLLLGFTGLSGLLLYAASDTTYVAPMLAVHLGSVLSLFLLMPYSKMVHGFFRLAALVREAQQQT